MGKKTTTVEELKVLPIDQIKNRLIEWRQDLLKLRLNAATAHVKDYSQFRKMRINIARALTVLRAKQEKNGVCHDTKD